MPEEGAASTGASEKVYTFDLKKWLFFGFLLLVFSLELQVALNRPIVFGDEGFHVANARYIGENVEYPLFTPLYGSELQQERFNRPPLWNLIEGSFYMFFGFHETIVQFLQPFIALLTGLVIFYFVRKLYGENTAIVAGIIAVTIPSFVTYTVAFYTTIPYVFFFSIAFLSFLTTIKTGEKKFWIIAGIFTGLSILANIAGLFLIFFIAAVGLVEIFRKLDRQTYIGVIKRYGFILLVAALLVLPWVGRNIHYYYLPGCDNLQSIITGNCYGESYQSAFQFEGRTRQVGTETGILSFGLTNYLQFAYGFTSSNPFLNLIGLAFIPFTFIAGLFIVLRRRDTVDIAIFAAVVIFALIFFQFGGLFSGRSEDTARYFLSAAPLIGILSGIYIATLLKFESKRKKIILISAMIIVAVLSLTSVTQKLEIMGNVKNFSPLFFEACDWTKENLPQDANMLSLHTYPTRYNCERAAVWEIPDKGDIVLSNNISLVKERLALNGIDYIFVQKFSLSQQAFSQSYPVSFVQFLENNSDSFRKVYENGPPLQQCIAQGGCDGTIIYQVV